MSIAKPTPKELREHYFLFPDREGAVPRFPNFPSIQFTEAELEELLQPLRAQANYGHDNETWLRNQLAEAGAYFPRDLYHHLRPSLSGTERRFIKIQNAANALLNSLGVTSKSPRTLPAEIEAWLQMAAARYGQDVGLPEGVAPMEVHWDFWSGCKLPSVVVGISLLEYWASVACADLRKSIKNRKIPTIRAVSGAVPPGQKELRRRNSGDAASRLLIQNLARFWHQWTGKMPGAGFHVPSNSADGPFIRFAQRYFRMMQKHITDEHRLHFANNEIDTRLGATKDSIRAHLRGYKSQMERKKGKSSEKARLTQQKR
jgi:hypothetical protein